VSGEPKLPDVGVRRCYAADTTACWAAGAQLVGRRDEGRPPPPRMHVSPSNSQVAGARERRLEPVRDSRCIHGGIRRVES
jgi:hypothetical protein